MMDMPERIWITPDSNGFDCFASISTECDGGVEFVRADLIEAQLAGARAALSEAWLIADSQSKSDADYADTWPDERRKYDYYAYRSQIIAAAIRALIAPPVAPLPDDVADVVKRLRGKYCCGDDVECRCDATADLIEAQASDIAALRVERRKPSLLACLRMPSIGCAP